MNISYSSLETFINRCPYSFKLRYVDKVGYIDGSIYTTYGKALHSTLQKVFLDSKVSIKDYFTFAFKKELKRLSYETKVKIFQSKDQKKILKHMMDAGPELCELVIKELNNKFPGFEIISVEQKFVEPILISENDHDFVGTIDFIFKTPDGLYHVLDWKSTSWGWDAKKRSDKWLTYQLTYYKHYFCLQTEIDPKNVKTHFGLLKRIAKKDQIEIFEVPVGEKKIKNALKVLDNVVYNIDNKNFPKNKTHCKFCDYYHTIHCNAK